MKASSKRISLTDVKSALLDQRFRNTLPEELLTDVQKFLNNPGCACNHPIYRKVLSVAKAQLAAYYPDKEAVVEEVQKVARNDWTVINCSISELQSRLQKLAPGRKQVEVARFQDQVTVIVNELDLGF